MYVIDCTQLGNTSGQHHGEEVDKERTFRTKEKERSLTQLLKPMAKIIRQDCVETDFLLCKFSLSCLFPSDDINEVVCEYKGNSLSLYSKFALEVAQKVTKVNVDQLEKRELNSPLQTTHFCMYLLVRSLSA